jgi:hypothetical protein
MSASNYQEMITLSFTPDEAALQEKLSPLYQELEEALQNARPGRNSQETVGYRFERLRLGMGITLMQLLTDLGGDEDSALVQDLLEDALEAPTSQEIDRIIQQKSNLFEDLYTDLYVNQDAEQVLAMFEGTLNASSLEEADGIIARTLELLQDLEFQQDEEDAPED